MRTFIRFLFVSLFSALLLAGCATNTDIDDLQKQIDALTNTQIASVSEQMTSIRNSIGDLTAVDEELRSLIDDLREEVEGMELGGGEENPNTGRYQEILSALEALEEADAALDQRIKNLKTYCDQQDNGVKTWASTTFATLEQHSAVLTEIAGIKTRLGELTQMIGNLDTTLSQKITAAENSVKSWVNGQLAGYYTIAQIDAKIQTLESGYSNGDAALTSEISTLRGNLDKAKTDLTSAYQTAISTAIEQNNGTINAKIAADIKTASDALQAQIIDIKDRLETIETRLSVLEASVAKLIGMIQSVVVVPDYADGSVKISNATDNSLRFEVYPLSAAADIAERGPSILSLDYVETQTRAGSIFKNLPITAVSFTGEVLEVTVDGSGLSDDVLSGVTPVNARLRISDGTTAKSSEYFPLVPRIIPVKPVITYTNLSTILALSSGTSFELTAIVAFITSRGDAAIVTDGTNYFYLYKPSPMPEVGDIITASGTINVYNHLHESAQGATVTVVESGATLPTLTPRDITATFGSFFSVDPHPTEYITAVGTYVVDGSYTNLVIDGVSVKGSLRNSSTLRPELNGKTVRVTGWFTGSNASAAFIYWDQTSIEEVSGGGNGSGGGETSASGWLELPAMPSGTGCLFGAHDMSGAKYISRVQSGLRNWSCWWDPANHVSHWVAYPLNNSIKGSGSRTEAWGLFDPCFPIDNQPDCSYTYGGGWTRGHQIPSADRLKYGGSTLCNESTYYPTNMTPQEYNFNGGIWANLEKAVRNYASDCDTLYVVTGCDISSTIGYSGDNTGFSVPVPCGYWKALLSYKRSSTSGFTGTADGGYFSGCAYYLPHDENIADESYTTYRMTLDALEQQLGIDLFVNLADKIGADKAAQVEAATPGTFWQ